MNAREQWLEGRRTGIGGSDAAAVLGVSEWRTPLDVYMDKTGVPKLIEDSEAMFWGRQLEDVVARVYAERSGFAVQRFNKQIINAEFPCLIANIDRLVSVDGKAPAHRGQIRTKRLLECKTANGFAAAEWGEPGTDEAPAEYVIQCQHYMGLTDAEVTDIAVLIGGSDFRIYTVYRDDDLIAHMQTVLPQWWDEHIVNLTPPDITYDHRCTMDSLKRMYPGTNGELIEGDDSVQRWHRVLIEASQQAKRYEAVADGARAHLLGVMGESSILDLPDDNIQYTRKSITRKGFTVEPTTYIDFRMRKRKEKS